MSDESFFREVDSELRSERMQDFWSRWGKIVIAVAVLVVVVIAGSVGYQAYTANQAAAAGDAYIEAVELAEEGKAEESRAALAELANSTPSYRALADMRRAAELRAAGQTSEAIALYDTVARDTAIEENLRAIADMRAAYIEVDTADVAAVEARANRYSAPSAPWRGSAHEAMGMAHYKAGDLDKAFAQFKAIADDAALPSGLRQRATIMLNVIGSAGGPIYEQPAS